MAKIIHQTATHLVAVDTCYDLSLDGSKQVAYYYVLDYDVVNDKDITQIDPFENEYPSEAAATAVAQEYIRQYY